MSGGGIAPAGVAKRRAQGRAASGVLLAMLTFAIALALWQVGAWALALRTPVAEAFGPLPAAQAAWSLIAGGEFARHAAVSLQRLGAGLLLGLMPGDAPVIFLLAFAALWPILLNTAAGVAALDPDWMALARSLSATRRETIVRIVLPGITAHLLTGVRLALGLLWIVIVPAEMLGVSAGLGHFVLDTRDRLAYPELMAAIVLIGALGWGLDAIARALHARWTDAAPAGDARARAAMRWLRQTMVGAFSRAAAARRPAG